MEYSLAATASDCFFALDCASFRLELKGCSLVAHVVI
jgi:hypothetical protein